MANNESGERIGRAGRQSIKKEEKSGKKRRNKTEQGEDDVRASHPATQPATE